MSASRFVSATTALVAMILLPRGTAFADSSYCRKVRAEAGESAALLMWPKLLVEGYRFPTDSQLGPSLGNGFQPRASVSFSPTEVYRGVKRLEAADLECERQDAAVALQDWIAIAAASANLAAVGAQVAYLDAHREEWRRTLAQQRGGLQAGLITVVELNDLRRTVGMAERRLEAQRSEMARLAVQVRAVPPVRKGDLAAQVTERTLASEGAASHVLALGTFQVRLTGGIIPTPKATDWFARLELSYDLGGPSRAAQAQRARAARDEELRTARYELPTRAAEVEESLRARAASARRELQSIDDELSAIESTQAALADPGAPSSGYELARLGVEHVLLESERVFLRALIGAPSTS